MVTTRQVSVLGLGRFGQAVARELTRLGHDVLAIDRSHGPVQDLADEIAHAAQAEITDIDVLRELGVGSSHTAIVAVSSSIEASILATVLVKQLGVPHVVAKASSELHGSILQKVGADRVVYPERETGMRVAHSFAAPAVRGYLDVAPGYGIVCMAVPDTLAGKSLSDLDLRRHYSVTPVALHRRGTVTLNPHTSEVLRSGDELVLAGLDEDFERLPGAASPSTPNAT